jgi:uncharacterized glyoxalase superfamily protein PhnB
MQVNLDPLAARRSSVHGYASTRIGPFSNTPWRRPPNLPSMAQTVTPYLLYEDGEAAIDFLTRAFGFREVERATGEGGGLHAELEATPFGGRIYLGEPPGGFRNPSTVGNTAFVYVVVDEVDSHCKRAKRAGAKIIEELTDVPYGHRRYGCADPQGHEWYFAQPIAGGDHDD